MLSRRNRFTPAASQQEVPIPGAGLPGPGGHPYEAPAYRYNDSVVPLTRRGFDNARIALTAGGNHAGSAP
jgi:hypothetical protein